jgi:hypothetical protein
MFPDLKSEAQAIVKVLVGQELNLPPFASISGIHMVAGKPVIGANLIATMIAKHPHYSFRINKCTKEMCEISFYNSKSPTEGMFIGKSSFTIQEAQEAGLLGKDNWKKYASDMLFARAISRGAKRYAADIFGGTAVYTADELNVEQDEDGVVTNIEKQIDYSDAAIVEEFKQTNAISDGGM